MATTLVSSKGQVIIPKIVREARHWTPGTQLQIRDTPEGVLLTRLATGTRTPIKEGLAAIRKRVDYRGPAKTVEEMDKAVLSEAARRQSGK